MEVPDTPLRVPVLNAARLCMCSFLSSARAWLRNGSAVFLTLRGFSLSLSRSHSAWLRVIYTTATSENKAHGQPQKEGRKEQTTRVPGTVNWFPHRRSVHERHSRGGVVPPMALRIHRSKGTLQLRSPSRELALSLLARQLMGPHLRLCGRGGPGRRLRPVVVREGSRLTATELRRRSRRCLSV